jgi:predicted transposase YdaD
MRTTSTLSYNFAGLVFTDEVDQQWLKERFEKMQDILEDSWVYQEMTAKSLEKGRQQGREEGREEGRQQGGIQAAQQIAISIVARRFPELELLARAIISMIDNLHQLQMLAIELSVASSQEETKHLLFSLGSAI